MKKVSVKFLARNDWKKKDILDHPSFVELSRYDESVVAHDDGLDSYSFDSLVDSFMTFGSGLMSAAKGFGGMLKWSAVIIISGLKWAWSHTDKKKPKEVQ